MHIDQASGSALQAALENLEGRYRQLCEQGLSLDLTRGKPCTQQVALSDALDGLLQGDYFAEDGTDVRNYGGLSGLPEARRLFGEVLDLPPERTLIGGNGSLTLMYLTLDLAMREGLRGPESAWGNAEVVKFVCPVPGYDRHFAICEHLDIEMVTVPMTDQGPDMDQVEALVQSDPAIRGIWCVPRFSNPTGCVYSDETVERLARLGQLASEHFLVMWDNAYAVHTLDPEAPALASISAACDRHGTGDNVFLFGSTSKITQAGAGVSFMGSSADNLAAMEEHLSFMTIGPDKVNQLRHVRFLRDSAGIEAHMARHAALVAPRMQQVLDILEQELGGTGMGEWTRPRGGYFISFDSRPGLARAIVQLAAEAGVKLTPAGATFPYGNDPRDANIRLAPTYPSLQEVDTATRAFTLCVQLASVRQRLA